MLRLARSLHRAANMASKPPLKPVIAIVGSTGTGKSQLAVDLAVRFNGEIVNSDTIQMYEGLPIITNKIPFDERKGVPHHLLGTVSVTDPLWRVDKFVKEAVGTIDDIHERGKLPIVVGGTNYYTHSLLFHNTLADGPKAPPADGEDGLNGTSVRPFPILDGTNEDMLAMLKDVDPIMANRWHPNDRRKIRRSLEIYLKTGQRASDLYNSQRSASSGSEEYNTLDNEDNEVSHEQQNTFDTNESLRYPTLTLCTHVSGNALQKRLKQRVVSMMDAGLLKEAIDLDAFHRSQAKKGVVLDKSRGIQVAIGYKEFDKLLKALQRGENNIEALQSLEQDAVQRTANATNQYSHAQLRWIRNKLVNALRSAGADPPILVVDTTDIAMWETEVLEPSTDRVERFLNGEHVEQIAGQATSRQIVDSTANPPPSFLQDVWIKKTCELCNVTSVTEKDWQQHINSRRHLITQRSRRKRSG